MPAQSADLLIVEREGVLHKAAASEIAALGGGGGGGDVVGPASVTNDALAAFDGTTGNLLKAGAITLAQAIALRDEVIEARGDRSTLGMRLSTISNFASPNAGGIVTGRFYDNAFHGSNSSTSAGAANRLEMSPFYTSTRLRVDQIGAAVLTAGTAGALGRLFIYGSDGSGWPDDLLFEGDSNLAFDSTGYKFHPLDFTFDSGRQYWLGCRWSSNGTMRAVLNTSMTNLGLMNPTGNTYATMLRRTLAFATPLPAAWDFQAANMVNGHPVSVRMRAAAL